LEEEHEQKDIVGDGEKGRGRVGGRKVKGMGVRDKVAKIK